MRFSMESYDSVSVGNSQVLYFCTSVMVLVVCHHRTGILITTVCALIRFVFTRFEAVTHSSEVVPQEQVHGERRLDRSSRASL
jgi:hypothetical protein